MEMCMLLYAVGLKFSPGISRVTGRESKQYWCQDAEGTGQSSLLRIPQTGPQWHTNWYH